MFSVCRGRLQHKGSFGFVQTAKKILQVACLFVFSHRDIQPPTEALEGHFYLLLTTYYLSLITYYLLIITYYLLLITYHIIYHPYNGGKLQIYIPCNSRSCSSSSSSSCSSSIFVVDVAVSLS